MPRAPTVRSKNAQMLIPLRRSNAMPARAPSPSGRSSAAASAPVRGLEGEEQRAPAGPHPRGGGQRRAPPCRGVIRRELGPLAGTLDREELVDLERQQLAELRDVGDDLAAREQMPAGRGS